MISKYVIKDNFSKQQFFPLDACKRRSVLDISNIFVKRTVLINIESRSYMCSYVMMCDTVANIADTFTTLSATW